MIRLRITCAVVLCSFYCAVAAFGQDQPTDEQILANLKFNVPQLRESDLELRSRLPSSFAGFQQGSIIVDGAQVLHFLLSDETSELLLLLSPSFIDIGISLEDLADLQEEEARQSKLAEQQQHEMLLSFSEGMASRGPADAPVIIFEFSDFQCPYCLRAFDAVEQVLSRYPETVRFVYLHFPLVNHDWARPAAIASVCAANQSDAAFWTLHDNYFRNQQQLTPDNLIEASHTYLEGSGIDLGRWEMCASVDDSEEYQLADAVVEESITTASTVLGLNGTPSFFVNGKFLSGAQPLEVFEEVIDEITGRAFRVP